MSPLGHKQRVGTQHLAEQQLPRASEPPGLEPPLEPRQAAAQPPRARASPLGRGPSREGASHAAALGGPPVRGEPARPGRAERPPRGRPAAAPARPHARRIPRAPQGGPTRAASPLARARPPAPRGPYPHGAPSVVLRPQGHPTRACGRQPIAGLTELADIAELAVSKYCGATYGELLDIDPDDSAIKAASTQYDKEQVAAMLGAADRIMRRGES